MKNKSTVWVLGLGPRYREVQCTALFVITPTAVYTTYRAIQGHDVVLAHTQTISEYTESPGGIYILLLVFRRYFLMNDYHE